ncbi:MAG: (2Fe-2S) ferredoxin domain-containing protein [Chloroflexota bacterium]
MKTYSRHLLFCTGSDCDGKSLAKEAKKLLGKDSVHIKRSKVSCLGACKHGPVMIVYPDGVWYRCPNKAALKQIVEDHIQGGKPVKKYLLQSMKPVSMAD